MAEIVYRLIRPQGPWGDYGDVLRHGIPRGNDGDRAGKHAGTSGATA